MLQVQSERESLTYSYISHISQFMHLSMLSPGGGGTPGICGTFDFSEDLGPEK